MEHIKLIKKGTKNKKSINENKVEQQNTNGRRIGEFDHNKVRERPVH